MDYFLLQLQTSGIRVRFPIPDNKGVVELNKVRQAISFFESYDYTALAVEKVFRPAMRHFSVILSIPETFSADNVEENNNYGLQSSGTPRKDEAILELVSAYKGFYNLFNRRAPCDKKRIPNLVQQKLTYQIFEKLIRTKNMIERKWNRQIIYAIYKDCIPLRSFIRNQISDILHVAVHRCDFLEVTPVLLGLMDCLIKGFMVPIKEENKKMILGTILPLYKSPYVDKFHEPLYACLESFVRLDSSHIHIVIEKMVLIWPAGAQKQVMYINSMDRLLDAAFVKFALPMCDVIQNVTMILNKGLLSPSSMVTDESLNFLWRNLLTDSTWHSGYIYSYIARLNEIVLKHWNMNTKIQAGKCLRNLESLVGMHQEE